MNFQRYLLIGAIAALSFMLLTEWVNFRDQKKGTDVVAAYQQQQKTSYTTATPVTESELPTAIASTGNDADIPSFEPLEPTNKISVVDSVDRIKVKTDALEIDINTKGGDIVFAALPKHFAELNNPEIPFILLEQSNLRTYIAQSGLIGVNGIDTAKGRAQFTS